MRSDIFGHLDISYCLSIETSGEISQALEGLDINNIYDNLPKFWTALKYIKLKDKCRNEKHLELTSKLTKTIENIDLYRIMYHDY